MPTGQHNELVRRFEQALKDFPEMFEFQYKAFMHTSRIKCCFPEREKLDQPFDKVLKSYPKSELLDYGNYFSTALDEAIMKHREALRPQAGLFD